MEFIRLKAKETIRKYCSPFDDVASHEGTSGQSCDRRVDSLGSDNGVNARRRQVGAPFLPVGGERRDELGEHARRMRGWRRESKTPKAL